MTAPRSRTPSPSRENGAKANGSSHATLTQRIIDRHDPTVERALLGAALLPGDGAVAVVAKVPAEVFASARHGHIAAAIAALHEAGQPVDVITLAAQLGPLLELAGGREYLVELQAHTTSHSAAPQYAEIVVEQWRERTMATASFEHAMAIADGDVRAAAAALERLDAARARGPLLVARQPSPTLDEFLASVDAADDYEWLIPELLERGDRLILTAEEGKGKSTLLRQCALRAAVGRHFFRDDRIAPVAVLYVDLENPERIARRKWRALRALVPAEPADRLRVEFRPRGLNLLEPEDADWLENRIAANTPDLLITGPIYKLVGGDPREEVPARQLAALLDRYRSDYGITLLIEAHSPYADGKSRRLLRPYGASLWSRWPEFGLHLSDTGKLEHWRGPRDERSWPSLLQRGGDWPWVAVERDEAPPRADGAVECADAIVELLEAHGGELSGREIGARLRDTKKLKYSNDVLKISLEAARKERRITCRAGARNAVLWRAASADQEAIDGL